MYLPKNLYPGLGGRAPGGAACLERGVTFAVGYNWRFQPALQEIRRMLDDGRLGKVLHIEGNFCGPSNYRYPRGHWRQDVEESPGGGMTGRGVHVIDAMVYLAGPIQASLPAACAWPRILARTILLQC